MSDEPGAVGDIDWIKEQVLDEPAAIHPRGTCYAGATALVITAHIQIHLGRNIYASSQQMIDCCLNPGGTNGGCCTSTLLCVRNNGVRFRMHYPNMPDPDDEARGYCLDCEGILNVMPRINIAAYKVICLPEREELLDALRNGPLVLDIFVSPAFHAYKTEDKDDILYDGVHAEGAPIDELKLHSVVLMGGKDGHWDIKNGWGPEWGFNGYAKISQDLTPLFLRAAYPVGVTIDWNGWDIAEPDEEED